MNTFDELKQQLKKEKDEIMWGIKCLAEDNINDFIDNRCNDNDKSKYTSVGDFKSELAKSYGWISQKIIANTMRELGFNTIRIYHHGKQRRCYVGIEIVRSIGDIKNNIMVSSQSNKPARNEALAEQMRQDKQDYLDSQEDNI